jgi:hypothetical protein
VSRFSFSPRRVGLVLVLAVAAVVANPAWSAALGIDVWNLPALQEQVEADATRGRELDKLDADVLRRMELKDRLVSDLIEGRTTLADVTAEFIRLNRDRPGYATAIRTTYAGRTDEERTARSILYCASRQLSHLPPTSRAAITTRLENEFADLFPTSAAAE